MIGVVRDENHMMKYIRYFHLNANFSAKVDEFDLQIKNYQDSLDFNFSLKLFLN